MAIALLSGGLDSTLAVGIMIEMGVEVEALHFQTIFCNCASSRRREGCGSEARRVSEGLGVNLKIFNVTSEYLEIVKNPKFGRGSSMNPCIDCRIFMLRKAKQYLEDTGADFVVTGEVLGQRPMSQHMRAIKLIEKESGLEGRIVRPLSAKLFAPTVPEQEGLIDRGKMLDIRGRSRKPQMQLAADMGITDYACPAGGCLLTDKTFGHRLRDLFEHTPGAGMSQVRLLKYGRHFRLEDATKVIVGRNKSENDKLEQIGKDYEKFQVADRLGAVVLAPKGLPEKTKRLVAAIAARYSQDREKRRVPVRCQSDGQEDMVQAAPIADRELTRWRIG